jgi:hypothetical protein
VLQVEGLLHHIRKVLVVVEPLRVARERAVRESALEQLDTHVDKLLAERVTHLKLDALAHVEQHLAPPREHLTREGERERTSAVSGGRWAVGGGRRERILGAWWVVAGKAGVRSVCRLPARACARRG